MNVILEHSFLPSNLYKSSLKTSFLITYTDQCMKFTQSLNPPFPHMHSTHSHFYSATLTIKTASSSETMVPLYQSTGY